MSHKKLLYRENFEDLLKQLSKQIQKELGRNADVELIVAGGAAIILNYSFRNSTTDIDAYIRSNCSIKSSIINIAEKNELDSDWLNSDFIKTESFSPKLAGCTKFYKQYGRSLRVSTIKPEYLIAMKLKSFRPYKNDKSDIVGIINNTEGLNRDKILDAYKFLYDSELKSKEISLFLDNIFKDKITYEECRNNEIGSKNILEDFIETYGSNAINSDNINNIINNLKRSTNTENNKTLTFTEAMEDTSFFSEEIKPIPFSKDILEHDFSDTQGNFPINKTDDYER